MSGSVRKIDWILPRNRWIEIKCKRYLKDMGYKWFNDRMGKRCMMVRVMDLSDFSRELIVYSCPECGRHFKTEWLNFRKRKGVRCKICGFNGKDVSEGYKKSKFALE